MKIKIWLFLLFTLISCSSIPNDNVEILKSDYNNSIDKKEQITRIVKKLDKYLGKKEFIEFLNKAYWLKEEKPSIMYLENLALLISKELSLSNEELKKFNASILSSNALVFNYLSLLNLNKKDYINSYNEAWLAKTNKFNYLSDEIFLSFYILENSYNEMEEIIVDMFKRYPDYPLNKYNKLIYQSLKNPKMINENTILEARRDIRKIDSKFYPEIEIYKTKLLMMLQIIEANYYSELKDIEKLKIMKEKVNKSEIKDELNLNRINEFINFNLNKLGVE